jgi:LPS sulfotransferase NodH
LQNFKKILTLQDPKAKFLALEVGLLKGQTDYKRFIILGRSRTGSNFLRGLLNSHPAVYSLGEVFRNQDAIDFDHPDFLVTEKLIKLYQSDPITFLETVVFRKIPEQYSVLGFKLFYYHARTPPFDQLWHYLENHPEIHIIHIKRKNMLHTHLSRARAEQTDIWVNTSGQKEKQQALSLNYEACLQDFQQTRDWENWADRFFQNHPLIQVYYEDLASDFHEQAGRLQHFLNLKSMPLQPRTHKQSTQPLSSAIQNYAELKQRFAGSEWASFFEDG